MNTETDKQLAQLIEAIKTAGTDAHAFLRVNGADFADQIVKAELYAASAWLGLTLTTSVVLAVFSTWVAFKAVKDKRNAGDWGLLGFVAVVILALSMTASIKYASTVMKCKTAPSLVVAEKVMELISRK